MKPWITDLLQQLTLEEKVSMIHGNGLFQTSPVERLGIPALKMSDGPAGVRQEFPNASWEPVGLTDDFVSYLPSNTSLASTWSSSLSYAFGQVLGAEARGRGKDVILAPGINIRRSPLCGRNFEYMSEDPYLTAYTAIPLIKGIQENDVACCVKHYALNNQETDRMSVESIVDERTLREIYLPAFRAVIDHANAYSIMGAYNQFRGEYCCESKLLIQDILKGEWEYDGTVISDWGGVHDTIKTANHGVDIEMSVTFDFEAYHLAQPLIKAIKEGIVDESVLDDKVSRILRMMKRLHMFDETRKTGCFNSPEHRNTLLRIAEESIVLLKNDSHALPLDPKKVKKIAVIGDNATRIQSSGGGSAEIKALYEISPLLGIKMRLGGNAEVSYSAGYYVDNVKNVVGEVDWQATSLTVDYESVQGQELAKETIWPLREKLLAEAVALAKDADEVIFIGGLNHAYDVEGFDKSSMTLPYGQDALIQALLEVNPDTTLVILSGSAVEMGLWSTQAKALLWSSYNGMEGGYALARVLFGDVNPSGKLPETFPRSLADSPAHALGDFPGPKDKKGNRSVNYQEGIFVGYRYFATKKIAPAFCFGHGLSYTDFEYSNLDVTVLETNQTVQLTVTFDIKNIGLIEGKEIVQLYISDLESCVERPVLELKNYAKPSLQPGEMQSLSFTLKEESLAFFDTEHNCFKAEAGTFELFIGSSSQDLRLSKHFELKNSYEHISKLI